MATKQDAAVSAANTLISLHQTLRSLRLTLNDFITQYNSEGYSATWAALATAAQNADGSLGAVDGAPNTAHPIDTRVSAQAGLSRAVTQAQLVAGVVLLQQIQKLLTNLAPAQANYNQTVDDLAG